ncbi:MAG: DUF1015 domain-containing protein [Clostridiales bacterium]|nr:DUF1015 domain-containing protein [Clostridiales bacterium]
MNSIYSDIAVAAPKILLPKSGLDLKKWAVIACDQFTSEPKYWEAVENEVGEAPSTLRMFLPEVYLESETPEQIDARLSAITSSITKYIDEGILSELEPGFILLDRQTKYNSSRKGLMLSLDLEQYDFTPGNKSRIRATEGTVLSRIPPRVRIRERAPIEMPHIMVLINDPEKTVIEPALLALAANTAASTPNEALGKLVYDTDLMCEGGHIRGFFTPAGSSVSESIISALRALLAKSEDGFLFAVGDGNHSLATAKKHWENIRDGLSDEEKETHPARYCLVEVVNIHDDGLQFEPIHRVTFGLTKETFLSAAKEYFANNDIAIERSSAFAKEGCADGSQTILVTDGSEDFTLVIGKPSHTLAVGSLQGFLDSIESSEIHTDYIHGEDSVRSLSAADKLGFLLPDVSKNSFFETISKEGVFPRKTFSMGEAVEKRYYLEAKKI